MKDKINNLFTFLINTRRQGTTSFIKGIAKEYAPNVTILVANEGEKNTLFSDNVNVVSLNDKYAAIGHKPLPILFDNHVLIEATEEAIEKISFLEQQVAALEAKNRRNLQLLAASEKRESGLESKVFRLEKELQNYQEIQYGGFNHGN